MHSDLVIFDNDGVLVDSEPIANRLLAEYLTELGFPTTYEDSLRDYMGAAIHRVHDLIHERYGRQLHADFNRKYHDRLFHAFGEELRPIKGAVQLIKRLQSAKISYCVASSGDHQRIRASLRVTGLYEYFGERRIFSAQDVSRGKPAPDLFLHAAKATRTDPEQCIVIEDSQFGVQAARAAGMRVYGFAAMTPAARLAAEMSFESMCDLETFLFARIFNDN